MSSVFEMSSFLNEHFEVILVREFWENGHFVWENRVFGVNYIFFQKNLMTDLNSACQNPP